MKREIRNIRKLHICRAIDKVVETTVVAESLEGDILAHVEEQDQAITNLKRVMTTYIEEQVNERLVANLREGSLHANH